MDGNTRHGQRGENVASILGGLLSSAYFVAHAGALDEGLASSEWQKIMVVEYTCRGRIFDLLKSDNVEGCKFIQIFLRIHNIIHPYGSVPRP